MHTWTDDQLGSFSNDGHGWSRTLPLPGFRAFRYGGLGKPLLARGISEIELVFDADDESDIPTVEETAVARRVVDRHEQLIEQGITALFEDMTGAGRNSGTWWHANISQVREIVTSRIVDPDSVAISEPCDLALAMGQPSILIQEFGYDYDDPCGVINFEAIFEPEHGVGFLTDGVQILGVGFQMDVSPFQERT